MIDKYSSADQLLKPSPTPMSSWLVDKWSVPTDATNSCDKTRYLEAIGEVLYLAITSRPDISYTASRLAQYSSCPSKWHWLGFIRLLRYLKHTINLHLVYVNTPEAPPIEMWADADWAGDRSTRRSQSGCIIKVFGCVILWQSSKQRCVANSTLEAEYIAYARAARNVLWICKILRFCMPNTPVRLPIQTWSDNTSCISSLVNEMSRSDKLRHIDVSYKFVRELISRQFLKVNYIESSAQVADILTKALESPAHNSCVSLLGLTSSMSS